MVTREGGYFSFLTGEGTYREEAFQRDLAVIQATYYDRGFINVRVDKPTISLSADKRYIYITIKLTEGEAYDIGKLDFGGDLVVPKERHGDDDDIDARASASTAPSSRTDILTITDVYYDQGYAYANINPVTSVNADTKTVDLTFDVQKGPQVTIERIDVVGNTKTRDKVIRRELRVYEGELYSGTGVRRSKERVTALGFFETVDVTQKPGTRRRQDRPPGRGEGEGHRHLPGGPGLLQRGELHLHGAGVPEQLPGVGPERVGLGADLRPALARAAVVLRSVLPGHAVPALGGLLPGGRGLRRLRAALHGRQRLAWATSSSTICWARWATRASTWTWRPARAWARCCWPTSSSAASPAPRACRCPSIAATTACSPRAASSTTARWSSLPKLLGGTFLFTPLHAPTRACTSRMPLGFVFKTNATVGYIQQLDPDKPLPISELYYLGGINTVRGYFLRSISPTLTVPAQQQPGRRRHRVPLGRQQAAHPQPGAGVPRLREGRHPRRALL